MTNHLFVWLIRVLSLGISLFCFFCSLLAWWIFDIGLWLTVWVSSGSTPRFLCSIWFPFCSDTLVGQKQMVGQIQSFVPFSFSIHLLSQQAVTSSTVVGPFISSSHSLLCFSSFLFADLFFTPSPVWGLLNYWLWGSWRPFFGKRRNGAG